MSSQPQLEPSPLPPMYTLQELSCALTAGTLTLDEILALKPISIVQHDREEFEGVKALWAVHSEANVVEQEMTEEEERKREIDRLDGAATMVAMHCGFEPLQAQAQPQAATAVENDGADVDAINDHVGAMDVDTADQLLQKHSTRQDSDEQSGAEGQLKAPPNSPEDGEINVTNPPVKLPFRRRTNDFAEFEEL